MESRTEKHKLQINEVAEKTGQSGKTFWMVKTSDGLFRCFDKPAADMLKLCVGKMINADILVSYDGKFKTIKGAELDDSPGQNSTGIGNQAPDNNWKSNTQKEIRAGVAYRLAIDLIIADKWDKSEESLHALANKLYNSMTELAKK